MLWTIGALSIFATFEYFRSNTSVIRIVINAFNNIFNVVRDVHMQITHNNVFQKLYSYHITRRIGIATEILKNFRDGTVSFSTLRDFCLMHARMCASKIFESGHLHNPRKNTSEVVFYSGSSRYRMVFPHARGVRQILRVYSRNKYTYEEGDGLIEGRSEIWNEEDVTQYIFECMGPGRNFYGIPTSPKLLGFEGLRCVYRTGEEKIYACNDIIQLKI